MEKDADKKTSGTPEGYEITLKTRMFGELWRGEFTINSANSAERTRALTCLTDLENVLALG